MPARMAASSGSFVDTLTISPAKPGTTRECVLFRLWGHDGVGTEEEMAESWLHETLRLSASKLGRTEEDVQTYEATFPLLSSYPREEAPSTFALCRLYCGGSGSTLTRCLPAARFLSRQRTDEHGDFACLGRPWRL